MPGMAIMPTMETIETALFEDPFAVYVVLALAAAAVVVAWRAAGRSDGWLATRLLVVAVLAVGVFATERLVVTDREQIQLALRDIAASVPAGRVDHAMTYLDEKYMGWGKFKPGVVLAVKLAVAKYQIQEIRLLGTPPIEVADKLAECKVSAIITYMSEGKPAKYLMAWNVKWIKRPEGWRIQGAEPTTDVVP